MSVGLPVMKSVLTPLDKNILVTLALTAVVSATDAAIQNNIFGSQTTALIISNKERKDIMKTLKFLEELGLLINSVRKTIKGKAKE